VAALHIGRTSRPAAQKQPAGFAPIPVVLRRRAVARMQMMWMAPAHGI
jgi:hypothetical protein